MADLRYVSFVMAATVGLPAWALDEHDAAKAAVVTEGSLPLEAIVEQVTDSDSKVLDARIEQDDHRYRYRLKLLESGHRVREIVVDGRTGAVVAGD